MSFYVFGSNLYIKQIQGVSQTDAPSELRAWPEIFIEACRQFAREQAFRTVRVPRADTLYSYHSPTINMDLLPDARKRSIKRIRRNIELLYDANALRLGFVREGDWFVWTNPKTIVYVPGSTWSHWFGRKSGHFIITALYPALVDFNLLALDICGPAV